MWSQKQQRVMVGLARNGRFFHESRRWSSTSLARWRCPAMTPICAIRTLMNCCHHRNASLSTAVTILFIRSQVHTSVRHYTSSSDPRNDEGRRVNGGKERQRVSIKDDDKFKGNLGNNDKIGRGLDSDDPLWSSNAFLDEEAVLLSQSDDINEGDNATAERREWQEQQDEIRNVLNEKKGRLWTDPWDTDEMMESNVTFDDLPDWSPSYVSRTSQERIQIHSDRIPTLATLASLPLPPPPPPHPGHPGQAKLYALYRKRAHYQAVRELVQTLAEPRLPAIQGMDTWEEKQDAVDALFEEIEFQIKQQEMILGKHPQLGTWVERALEEYLRSLQKEQLQLPLEDESASKADRTDENANDKADSSIKEDVSSALLQFPSAVDDAKATPIFMDCYSAQDGTSVLVPSILSPLSSNQENGRMVEDWDISAHDETRRILLRQSTRRIAQALITAAATTDQPVGRIYVHGRKGVGKTAALVSIVASARSSGYIVLYMPDGDQYHQNGHYIEPNAKRPGLYDLPVLSQRCCQQLLQIHSNELQGILVCHDLIAEHLTEEQIERLPNGQTNQDGMSLMDLLQLAVDSVSVAAMCYSIAVEVLMQQDRIPFLMVLDEFNCYYSTGQYYHMHYDNDAKRPIPYHQINLFKPAMDVMGITSCPAEEAQYLDESNFVLAPRMTMKRGGILVATTESHAVPRRFTDTLTDNARLEASKFAATNERHVPLLYCIEVPRFSSLEVDHIVANYEATGVGKLRLDRGETVGNEQEVAYLRVVSGGIAQNLFNACII